MKLIKLIFNTEHTDYDGKKWKKGDFVYQYNGHTYGCLSGKEIATCEKPNQTPFMGMPSNIFDKEEIETPPMTKEHMDAVCKPGAGAKTCRYLIMGSGGFECAKLMGGMKDTLDERVRKKDMVAIGDNCDGR